MLIGTCSWTDPALLRTGSYPREAITSEKRLQYYAQHFPIVEVDASYYSLPDYAVTRLWVERTPPDFIFDIKAFSVFQLAPNPGSFSAQGTKAGTAGRFEPER
jgi:uncharacterized protein YecE (DUF72 family)